MKFSERYSLLQREIEKNLSPLINSDYHLFDLPYHSNIGDTLIWEGELCFLKKIKYNCISYSSATTDIKKRRKVKEDDIILFHGGGNIGSIYMEHLYYLLDLTSLYSENRIVVFPQTVWFENQKGLNVLEKISQHKNLFFCCRDQVSFEFMSKYIQNSILLPDMAFCIPMDFFKQFKTESIKGSLYLKRTDGEEVPFEYSVSADYTKDWPTHEHKINDGTFIAKVLDNLSKRDIPFSKKIWNWYAYKYYKNDLLRIGTHFVKSYDPIYTTRLHVMILALLCNKNIIILDNKYNKISNFVNTWLKDVDEIKVL